MWISKRKWKDMEKRVVDLERELQDQPTAEDLIQTLEKANMPSVLEFKSALEETQQLLIDSISTIKDEIKSEIIQELHYQCK